jgi:hypothetical protein
MGDAIRIWSIQKKIQDMRNRVNTTIQISWPTLLSWLCVSVHLYMYAGDVYLSFTKVLQNESNERVHISNFLLSYVFHVIWSGANSNSPVAWTQVWRGEWDREASGWLRLVPSPPLVSQRASHVGRLLVKVKLSTFQCDVQPQAASVSCFDNESTILLDTRLGHIERAYKMDVILNILRTRGRQYWLLPWWSYDN